MKKTEEKKKMKENKYTIIFTVVREDRTREETENKARAIVIAEKYRKMGIEFLTTKVRPPFTLATFKMHTTFKEFLRNIHIFTEFIGELTRASFEAHGHALAKVRVIAELSHKASTGFFLLTAATAMINAKETCSGIRKEYALKMVKTAQKNKREKIEIIARGNLRSSYFLSLLMFIEYGSKDRIVCRKYGKLILDNMREIEYENPALYLALMKLKGVNDHDIKNTLSDMLVSTEIKQKMQKRKHLREAMEAWKGALRMNS